MHLRQAARDMALPIAVEEIDQQAETAPDGQHEHGVRRKGDIEPHAADHGKRGDDPHCGGAKRPVPRRVRARSEEHTSELQSLMRISYAVFCLKKTYHTSNAN